MSRSGLLQEQDPIANGEILRASEKQGQGLILWII